MNSRRLIALASLLITTPLVAAQAGAVAETRQATVPAPPFVVSGPSKVGMQEFQDSPYYRIENLSSSGILVKAEGKFQYIDGANKKEIDVVFKNNDITLNPREAKNVEIDTANLKDKLGKLNLRFSSGQEIKTYSIDVETTINKSFDYTYSAKSLAKEWKTVRAGKTVENSILTLTKPTTVPCKPIEIGSVSNGYSNAIINAYPKTKGSACSDFTETNELVISIKDGKKLPAGEYTGSLKLPFDGSKEGEQVKATLLQTSKLWLAIAAILLGVASGFLYRYFSGRASEVAADKVDALQYQKNLLQKAKVLGLNAKTWGQTLQDLIEAAALKEHAEIETILDAETGLVRNPDQAKNVALRLAVFRQAATDYESIVKTLDNLQPQANPKNALEKYEKDLTDAYTKYSAEYQALKGQTQNNQNKAKMEQVLIQSGLTVDKLSSIRTKLEAIYSLVTPWQKIEISYAKLKVDLSRASKSLKLYWTKVKNDKEKALALQVAQDLIAGKVALSRARRLLDQAEPNTVTTQEIQQALSQTIDSLESVRLKIILIEHGISNNYKPKSHSLTQMTPSLMNGHGKNKSSNIKNWLNASYRSYSLGGQIKPITPLEQATLMLRHQQAMRCWRNLWLAAIALLLALASGLPELYFGKPFGWLQVLQAFMWGFGLKFSIDNIFLYADRLLSGLTQRPAPAAAKA